MSSTAESKPHIATQVKVAARNITITVVVLGTVFTLYSRYVKTTAELKALREKVTGLVKHDSARDYAEAGKALEQGLALRDGDPWFIATRGEVAALLWVEGGDASQKGSAESFTRRAVDMGINTSQRFNAEALTLIGNGQIEKAGDKLTEIVTKTGAASAAMVSGLGMVHQRMGKLEMAKNDFKQAADRDWLNPRFGALYAQSLFDAAEYGTAQGLFQKALEGNPNHLRSLIGKARADVALNDHVAEAIKTFDDALANTEGLSPVLKIQALVGKAEALLAAGDAAQAETVAKQAIEAKVEGDPSVAYAYYDLGRALAVQKKPGALEAFKQALSTVSYIPHFYFDGALSLAREGQSAEATSLLEPYGAKLVDAQGKMKPDDAYHRARGQLLTLGGQFDEALKEYDLAIADNSVNADSYYAKGLVYKAQALQPKADKVKLLNNALDQFDKAIGFRERFPDAYREEGLIFLDHNPKDDKVMEKFTKAILYYKDAHAPKAVTEAFITDVETAFTKKGPAFKTLAAQWRKDATGALKP